MNFKSFIEAKKSLEENSLYTTPQERQAIVSDKSAVADIFVYNFLSMLGLINGVTRAQHKSKLQLHFKKEKQVQIQNIGDDNHDMSIAVKLAKEAGFFRNDMTVSNITKFLAKLKLGQITEVDSKIIAGWVNDMTPEFFRSISDPKIRTEVRLFSADKGENIDISRVTLAAKRKANKASYSGEFKELSKIVKVDEKLIGSNVPVQKDGTAPAPAGVTASPKVAKPVVDIPQAPPPAPPKPTTIKTKINLADRRNDIASSIRGYLILAGTSLENAAMKRIEDGIDWENRNAVRLRGGKGTPIYTQEEIEIIKEKIKEVGKFSHKLFKLDVPSVGSGLSQLATKLDETTLFSNMTYANLIDSINQMSGVNTQTAYNFEQLSELILFLGGHTSTIASSPLRVKRSLVHIENSNLGNKSEYSLKDFIKNMSIKDLAQTYSWDSFTDINSQRYTIAQFISAKMQAENIGLADIGNLNSYRANDYMKEIYFNLDAMPDSDLSGYDMKDGYRDALRNFVKVAGYDNSKEALTEIVIPTFSNLVAAGKSVHPDFFLIIDNVFKNDLLTVGLQQSKMEKMINSTRIKDYLLKRWNLSYKDLAKKFPGDKSIIKLRVEAEGTDNITKEELADYAEYTAFEVSKRGGYGRMRDISFEEASKEPSFALHLGTAYKNLYNKSKSNSTSVAQSLALSINRYPAIFDKPNVFKNTMHLFQGFEKEGTLEIIRVAKKNNFKNFFDPSIYKDTGRRAEKEEFVSILTSVMNDAIDSDVEDYISDIIEEMPGLVVGRIRNSLIGFKKLVDEVNKGEIQPFGTIDGKRLRTMLMMNDINPSSLTSGETPRKKRGEKWTDYFKRAKEELEKKTDGSFLGKEQVTLDKNANVKGSTKTYNSTFRSGNHGNTFVKILKTYNSSFKFPQFDEFRKNNFGDGTITPAFHGTGGIAASMILRYGFKVIKSSDPSVVGRMLGNGIYFSNKIDKALQYIGNAGYSRSYGTKGYIIEVDNTLGKKDLTNSNDNPDYRVMGLGNDNIRSPEWCVRDPKKQLAVVKVHEVEFSSESEANKYASSLNENGEEGFKGFKEFMSESKLLKMKNNVAHFTFRDGLIPILDKRGNIEYVDFEDAIQQKLMPARMIDYSRNGPVVVFENSKKNEGFDLRYADLMNGNTYSTYVENFNREVLNKR
jgi:hypothetical protein